MWAFRHEASVQRYRTAMQSLAKDLKQGVLGGLNQKDENTLL
jgi:hypothetical protein